jgi:hypothetical protein
MNLYFGKEKGDVMDTKVVTLELPVSLYDKLQELAAEEKTNPVEIIARLVDPPPQSSLQEKDPVLELIGAYRSQRPLIDNIPVSEDPDLYLIADTIGEAANGMHAWEIAPMRYTQGPDGCPLRRNVDETET